MKILNRVNCVTSVFMQAQNLYKRDFVMLLFLNSAKHL